MREILFKAKRTDNGEWVEGLFTLMWGSIIYYFGEACSPEDCEVIGNIFDNPELLKDGG